MVVDTPTRRKIWAESRCSRSVGGGVLPHRGRHRPGPRARSGCLVPAPGCFARPDPRGTRPHCGRRSCRLVQSPDGAYGRHEHDPIKGDRPDGRSCPVRKAVGSASAWKDPPMPFSRTSSPPSATVPPRRRLPDPGKPAFFENVGGSLTLKASVERTAELMAFPTTRAGQRGRVPDGGHRRGRAGHDARPLASMARCSSARPARNCSAADPQRRAGERGSLVIGSHLAHPATYSACRRWAEVAGMTYEQVGFDRHHRRERRPVPPGLTPIWRWPRSSTPARSPACTSTSPPSPPRSAVAPDCSSSSTGSNTQPTVGSTSTTTTSTATSSAATSSSPDNLGVAWVSDRLAKLHDQLDGARRTCGFGTRDASAYAAFSRWCVTSSARW